MAFSRRNHTDHYFTGVFSFLNRLKIVNNPAENNGEVTVLDNKVWEITFSKELNPDSVNSSSVYILNEEGEKSR